MCGIVLCCCMVQCGVLYCGVVLLCGIVCVLRCAVLCCVSQLCGMLSDVGSCRVVAAL